MTTAAPIPPGTVSPARAIIAGGLIVGILDGLDAAIFFGLRGAPIERIFQAIAAGVLGRDAFSGGIATALLGVFLHFVIAFGIVLTFYLVSRPFPFLTKRPVVFGAIYGVIAYLVMNYIVIPLSAAGGGGGPKPTVVLVNGLLIHILGVGIPAAYAARAASRAR